MSPYAEVDVKMLKCPAWMLCAKPYPGHRRGCPNLAKKPGCPTGAPMIGDVLDLSQPVFAVYTVFDLGEHVARMREKHPSWSERQLRCCLYWQPRARRNLRAEIRRFLKDLGPAVIVTTPEACGVNVTETMETCGIYLDWPPETTAILVVIAGTAAAALLRRAARG
ncbi:MAG: hypothetical protein IMZ50_12650 [Candidatus Atribacteria bacterium]|nr:hypothetical protein [Candidatus Atribacteria bacterium]